MYDKLVYSYILERKTKDCQCSKERKFIRKGRYYLNPACLLSFLFSLPTIDEYLLHLQNFRNAIRTEKRTEQLTIWYLFVYMC